MIVTARKHGPAIVQVGLAVMMFLSGLCVWWYNEPPPSVTYERKLVTTVVPQGGMVIVKNRVHRTKSCHTKIQRDIIDAAGKVTSFVRDWSKRPVGWDNISFGGRIPKDATTGMARLEVTIFWYCNPLQKQWPVSETQQVVWFKIIGGT